MEEAKEAALDQLGIDSSEAEFEVLEEPKTGLFGRIRGTARVRARVVPKSPRPKQERRPRKSRSKSDGSKSDGGGKAAKAKAAATAGEATTDPAEAAAATTSDPPPSGGRRGSRGRGGSRSGGRAADNQEGNEMSDDVVSVDEQADIISEFLEGLLDSLGIEGDINRTKVDDETVELGVEGADLGLLIGPKGQTLTAVHELSRTVLQRRATGRHDGRVRIDIGGYRQRRQEALARFVRQQAEEVVAQGVSRALEPMNAVDRKVVHDTINEIDGVSTLSEGIDPNRRVVIVVEGSEA
ncbi:MAG: Jag N-terminal domain-containing protein [Actinobacteria bacterium]|nr:Jag N-terminal domain-containing protein [Actinomycetota bacterium]